VKVFFEDPRLEKMFSNEKELRKQHGPARAKRIGQRVKDLTAAETLADMRQNAGPVP
jgi:plasmid maintenance system killer protein